MQMKAYLEKNPFPVLLSQDVAGDSQPKEHEVNKNTMHIIDKFVKVIQILKPLFQVNNKYSFREVFNNAGKELDGLQERFINRILILEKWHWSIRQQIKTTSNWQEWLAQLCNIIFAIEQIAQEFGSQRENWFADFSKANMNKLIEDYMLFIQQLKLLYIELGWDEPGFQSLRSLLIGDHG